MACCPSLLGLVEESSPGIRLRRAARMARLVSLCGEPFFKKGRSLGAFDTAPHRVHDTALCRAIAPVKSQPIRQVRFNRHALNVQFQSAQLEKALLEKHAQDFHPEKFPSDLRRQTRHEPIPRFNDEQILFTRYLRELVKVERPMHRIQSEYTGAHRANHFVAHAINPERHVSIRNSLQRAAANSPISRTEDARTEEAHGLVLSNVRFQGPDGRSFHSFAVRKAS